MTKKALKEFVVESETNAGKTYTVKVQSKTEATCTCPGFRYHKHCKHVRWMLAGLYEISA